MDRRTCAVMGAVYFELMNTLAILAQGGEVSKCTIEAFRAAAPQLEELGFRDSLALLAGELEGYNKLMARVKAYLRLMATDDEEVKMEVADKLNKAIEDANIARLRLSSYILSLLRAMAKRAEEC